MMKRQPAKPQGAKQQSKPTDATHQKTGRAVQNHPLKFLQIRQHQHDFLQWLVASDNSGLHFVR